MALIDKETIRAEIERRMFEDYNGPDTEQNETAQGVCAGLLAFLDTLAEQSEANKLEHCKGCKYYNEGRCELFGSYTGDLAEPCDKGMPKAEDKFPGITRFCEVADNLTRIASGKQPVEGLEEECERFYRTDEYKMAHNLGRGFEAIAYHFFDFGCRRTAEMYDDIEYNRQRAEEAEISKGLEEEIKRMVFDVVYDLDGPAIIGTSEYLSVKDIADIARHFAEWGAEHLKR